MQVQFEPDLVVAGGLLLFVIIGCVWFVAYYVKVVTEFQALTQRNVALTEEVVTLLREISAKLDRE